MTQAKIALIPLDERPVNTRYPQMIGEIGGANVLLPPVEIRGFLRQPANLESLEKWLLETVSNQDISAALISCDYLGYGNLINSRISDDSAAEVLTRLKLLEDIGAKTPVHAFSLISRVSNANDNVEEPLYWLEFGEKFYAYSRLKHRVEVGDELKAYDQAMLDGLENELPEREKSDWLTRRLRNHTVNLGLMDMAARGKIESLLLTSDDTAPFGFPTRERDWLSKWRNMLTPETASRIQMHPGADEVGSALVAKTINTYLKRVPKIWIDYAIESDTDVIALYEDRPISDTVHGQIEACGCEVASDIAYADIVLGVVTPSRRRIDYRAEIATQDLPIRASFYDSFLKRLAGYQSSGLPVALADVAFPNGSDPQMSELILAQNSPLNIGKLAAYGAWNTAGNTLGTVVAQASSSIGSDLDSARADAQKLFLAHRFLEDYGYQQIVRRQAREYAQKLWGRREPDPESGREQQELCAFIEARLSEILASLKSRGIAAGLSIAPGSVRLPWHRTFEVDLS